MYYESRRVYVPALVALRPQADAIKLVHPRLFWLHAVQRLRFRFQRFGFRISAVSVGGFKEDVCILPF